MDVLRRNQFVCIGQDKHSTIKWIDFSIIISVLLVKTTKTLQLGTSVPELRCTQMSSQSKVLLCYRLLLPKTLKIFEIARTIFTIYVAKFISKSNFFVQYQKVSDVSEARR